MAAPAAAAALLSCIIFFFVPLLFEGSGFPIRIIYCLLDGEEITREPVCLCVSSRMWPIVVFRLRKLLGVRKRDRGVLTTVLCLHRTQAKTTHTMKQWLCGAFVRGEYTRCGRAKARTRQKPFYQKAKNQYNNNNNFHFITVVQKNVCVRSALAVEDNRN